MILSLVYFIVRTYKDPVKNHRLKKDQR